MDKVNIDYWNPDPEVMKKLFGENWKEEEDLIHPTYFPKFPEIKNDLFHINDITEQIVCQCGNDKFYLGTGLYVTAVKCTKCHVEKTVHEG